PALPFAGGTFQAAAHRRGATLLLPRPPLAAGIDALIFDELFYGRVTERAVRTLREAVAELADAGAERVILGNTDMTLAVDRMGETAVPIIDGACAHARASARAALRGELPGAPQRPARGGPTDGISCTSVGPPGDRSGIEKPVS